MQVQENNTPLISTTHSAANTIRVLLQRYDEELLFPFEELRLFSNADLLEYLTTSHRYYLNCKLPEIEQTIYNLFRDEAQSDDLLLAMCRFFVGYQRKLEQHILAEEQLLFPYIKALLEAATSGVFDRNRFGNYSAAQFLEQHTDVEEDLRAVTRTIEQSLHHRNMPLPFRVFVAQLQQFEIDLCKHAIVEDEVLLPRILELEKRLNSNMPA